MILLATDLDNTLIYSYKRESGSGVCVEYKDGKALSYIEREAYRMLQNLPQNLCLVPVTTRSLEQYRRVLLYPDRVPHYALCANGAILLRHGEVDQDWLADSYAMIAEERPILEQGLALLEQDAEVTLAPRLVDGLFVFAKTRNPQQSLKGLAAHLNTTKIFLDQVGEKVYIFPKLLDKGLGLKRLAALLSPEFTIAAGDSSFDIPMLRAADLAVIPSGQAMWEKLPPCRCEIVCSGERDVFAQTVLKTAIRACEEHPSSSQQSN